MRQERKGKGRGGEKRKENCIEVHLYALGVCYSQDTGPSIHCFCCSGQTKDVLSFLVRDLGAEEAAYSAEVLQV